MRPHRSTANIVFYLSLPAIFLFLVLIRPPGPFYVLPLAPIALAAMLHGFAGGTLAALAAMALRLASSGEIRLPFAMATAAAAEL